MTLQSDPALVLRDIHQPPAPSWWPPAPGWWLLAGLVLFVVLIVIALGLRRRRRRHALQRLFDDSVAAMDTPAAKLAAMSDLLRRASRRIDPDADKLIGDQWLRFLDDGLPVPMFSAGVGAALREGMYRPDVSAQEVADLHEVTRARFLSWMLT